MRDDQDFLDAVMAQPGDNALRLVYADWLEENGDPRADYLRLELAVAQAPDGPEAPALRARMQSLRLRLDPLWLAHLDQPGVMRANPTPFPSTWSSIDLGPDRETDGTYGGFSYEELPPLPVAKLRGDFAWLRACQPWDRIAHVDRTGWRHNAETNLRRMEESARALQLNLPSEFLDFMGDVELQARVRSCTDCYFNLPARIVPSPMEGGGLVRFYSDSQGCLHWYLYVTSSGYHSVVLSGLFLGGEVAWESTHGAPDPNEEFAQELDEDPAGPPIWFCAPSFEAFLFRYWLENEIWYALNLDNTPLTPLQQAYLDHYRKT